MGHENVSFIPTNKYTDKITVLDTFVMFTKLL